MVMQDIQPAGAEAAAALFAEAVAQTGMVTMQGVVTRAGVSLKTVAQHRRDGLIAGHLRLVFGKRIWLFEPSEVERYAQTVREKIAKRVAAGWRRAGWIRAQAPAGYMTVADIVRASGRSSWHVYDAIERGELQAEPTGFKGAYIVPARGASMWINEHRYVPLPEDMATIPGAAKTYGISEVTLRKAVSSGRIAAYAIGEARTQDAPGAQVGRAALRVLLDDVREFSKRLRRRNSARSSVG